MPNTKYQPSGRRDEAFTMVEIALSIAVVAFALVAILGVLPTGMTVQKDNLDDTIINQEGRFWMETIRSGSRGVRDLTNYVESIMIPNYPPTRLREYTNSATKFLTSEDIIGLLTAPIPPWPSVTNNTNRVLARVKALTGAAAEKGALTNPYSFRYELQVELRPHLSIPPGAFEWTTDPTRLRELQQQQILMGKNLWDVRLVLRWPLYERGNRWVPGNNKKVFRTQIAGRMVEKTNNIAGIGDARGWIVGDHDRFDIIRKITNSS